MDKNFLDVMAYETDFIGESDMFARDDFNALKQYEILSVTEIAERIHFEPGKRVVFALFYEIDDNGTVIDDSLDGWFSISLQDNYEKRGKYLLLVGKMGARAGVNVGEKRVGAVQTVEQVQKTVRRIFDEFNFGQDSFCACAKREE